MSSLRMRRRGVLASFRPPPSLDLNLMSGVLDSRITFTRASSASYFDATGTLQTAGTNVARFDCDPVTHAPRGLLIEEARTNLLLNSATLGTQSVTVTAQAYTLSFYGTGTVTLTGTSTAGPLIGTGAFPARVSLTFTPTAGTLTLTVSGSVLNANLEAGSFATSYVTTAGASATRAADVATMPTGSWFRAGGGALAVEGSFGAVSLAGYAPVMAELDDGTTTNLIGLRVPATFAALQGVVFAANALAAAPSPSGIFTAGVTAKAAISYDTASRLVTAALNSQSTAAVATAMPAGISQISLGLGRSNALNGYIRRLRYWPRAMGSVELQAVTR